MHSIEIQWCTMHSRLIVYKWELKVRCQHWHCLNSDKLILSVKRRGHRIIINPRWTQDPGWDPTLLTNFVSSSSASRGLYFINHTRSPQHSNVQSNKYFLGINPETDIWPWSDALHGEKRMEQFWWLCISQPSWLGCPASLSGSRQD